MIRMVYPFRSYFSDGLGVNEQSLAFAVTLRSAFGALGPFLGFIGDRRGRKFGMIFGLGMFTIGAGLMVLWPSFTTFVITMILTLLGNLVFIPSMQAYLGDRVPYSQRGRALAITELSWSLSFILIVPLVAVLIARFGWLTPFSPLTILGALAIVVLIFVLPKDKAQPGQKTPLWQNLRLVVLFGPAVAGLLMGAAMSAANELMNLSFAVWMEDSFNVKIAALTAATLVIGFSELAGEGLVARFSDRLGKKRSIAIGLAANCLAAILLVLISRSLAGALAALSFFYLSFEFTIVSSIPLMTEVLPAARATLMASWIASISAGRAVGAFLSPYLYAWDEFDGIFTIVLGTLVLNVLAFLALRFIRTGEKFDTGAEFELTSE